MNRYDLKEYLVGSRVAEWLGYSKKILAMDDGIFVALGSDTDPD